VSHFRYQFYFRPLRQQIYQLATMAAAMAVDLGIHKATSSEAKNGSVLDVLNISAVLVPRRSLLDDEAYEERRTLLGCYYLTSS
jgi:hypothetical protein